MPLRRRIGEILIESGVLTKEQLDAALVVQKKERVRSKKTAAVIVFIFILSFALFIQILNKQKGIVIQEAKIVTGVNKEMLPLKVTNFFPKNTSKVSVWIRWENAKINTQILVKWYYTTDDLPIYDYNLNIPKKEGIANVVLSMPEGKALPSGLYKVTILSEKKQLSKPLAFEIQ